jgi:cytochrome c553
MKRGRGIVVGVIMLLIIVAVAWSASFLRHGSSAHDRPTAIEAFVARKMRHWATPADLRERKNPMPLTPEILKESRAHFADHCAVCHGNDGKGETEMGQHMYPRAPDMTLAATQSLSDGELFGIIENGIRLTGMPGWGNGTAESARSTWTLVHFVRHLPKITTEEMGEMEKLNLRTPEEYAQMQSDEEFLENGDTAAAASRQPQTNHHH